MIYATQIIILLVLAGVTVELMVPITLLALLGKCIDTIHGEGLETDHVSAL